MKETLMSERNTTQLVLLNGKLYGGDRKSALAEAIAVRDGRIAAIGDNKEIENLASEKSRIIDLRSRMVLPGFNDAHTHFFDGGFYLNGVDLRDAENEEEFRERIAEKAAASPENTWITGGNWDHELWASKRHPHKELIDGVTPRNPVLVNRLDMHISLANSAALELAGISGRTPDPPGGEIVRNERTGEPTGIVKDTAQDLIKKVIPAPSEAESRAALDAALQHAARLGVTSIQDNASPVHLRMYQRYKSEGALTVRVNAWLPIGHLDSLKRLGVYAPFGDDMVRIGCVKIYADGAMGSGTALFFEPYRDDPSTRGLAIYEEPTLQKLMADADGAGLQLAVHAIGDRANKLVLDAFEKLRAQNDGGIPRRHRIEHAQAVRDEDMSRFVSCDLVASLQPSHCIDDMRWLEKRLGPRARNAHRCKSFIDAGVPIALGTDWTVAPLDPLLGIYAAVTREFPEGGPENGWIPSEKLTLEEAIDAYTRGSAYAEYCEGDKGSLQVGKLADMVVLSQDLFSIPAREYLQTKVDMTILGGKIIYERI